MTDIIEHGGIYRTDRTVSPAMVLKQRRGDVDSWSCTYLSIPNRHFIALTYEELVSKSVADGWVKIDSVLRLLEMYGEALEIKHEM